MNKTLLSELLKYGAITIESVPLVLTMRHFVISEYEWQYDSRIGRN